MPAEIADAHQLGIGGQLQHVAADLNMAEPTIIVKHKVPAMGESVQTHLTQDQLRKAMGISHMNLNNVTHISVTSNAKNATALSGMTMSSGDGEMLPITDRHCAVVDGAVSAANAIAMPGAITETGKMHLKKLQTDKHNFTPMTALSEEDKQRNKLNAALYANTAEAPDDNKLYKHTVKATAGNETKIAIPLSASVTNEDGALTAVASRCVLQQKKSPKTLAPDASIIKMPHKNTGEECDHLLASAASVSAMAQQIKNNTKVHPTFGNGLVLETHGLDGEDDSNGYVYHKITLHREPTGEPHTVSYQKDLVPAEIAASVSNKLDLAAGTELKHENQWHAAMFGNQKADGAQTVQHDHEDNADGEDGGAA